MKVRIAWAIFFLAASSVLALPATPSRWRLAAMDFRLLPGSLLEIEGRSNINAFTYRYTGLPTSPSGSCLGDLADVLPSLLGRPLPLELAAFDSGHARMNRDLRRMLEAEEHPQIIVTANELVGLNEAGEQVPIASAKLAQVQVTAEIVIAGVSRQQQLVAKVDRQPDSIALSGSVEINTESYGLETPTALFGLIRVRPTITVSYRVVLPQDDCFDSA